MYNQIKEYNTLHIPEDYVVFESLKIKEDPDNPGYKIAPQERVTPSEEIFYDSKTHLICCIESTTKNIDGSDNVIYDNNMHFTKQNGWRIILRKGVPLDEKRYKFLMLNPKNKNNVLGITSDEFQFKLVDEVGDAKAQMLKEQKEIEFKHKILSLSDNVAINVAKTLGVDTKDGNVARSRLLTLAKNNPQALETAIDSYEVTLVGTKTQVDFEDKAATIQKAITQKKVAFNRETGVLYLTSKGNAHLFKVVDDDGIPKDIDFDDVADEISDDAYERIIQSFSKK